MKNKTQTISLHTAKNLIEKAKKAIVFNRQRKNPYKYTLRYIIKKYFHNHYDVNFLFPKLESYLKNEKEISELKTEPFIKESQNFQKQTETEKNVFNTMFYVICKGDPEIFKNSYGESYGERLLTEYL